MEYPVFQIKAQDGIVIVRKILFYRKPPEKFGGKELYGVSDKDIYERGLLNFNYHPDQWGGINHSYEGFSGTKVNGLPIMLMDDKDSAISMISMEGVAPVSLFRSEKEGKDDGAILLATFTQEQIRQMGIGVNVPFDRRVGQPFAALTPEIRGDDLFLRVENPGELSRLDVGLRSRFNEEGLLLESTGEFYISKVPPVEEYRDALLVFRPDKEGNGFNNRYWAKDIRINREGVESTPGYRL